MPNSPSVVATIAVGALLLGACGGSDETAPANGNESASPPAGNVAPAEPAAPGNSAEPSSPAWGLQSSGEGAALALLAGPDRTVIRLFCAAGRNSLLVNVPGFRPVRSEERLSFGSGGNAHALVADTRGDRQRGGVTGTGEVPDNLAALVGGPISASYGAQRSGPHPAPPQQVARDFVAACSQGAPPAPPSPPPAAPGGPCTMQGSERLRVAPIRAVGTEPFWGARIEGRCVTYSHPEDQRGTRVWTRYSAGSGGGGTWTGALGGHPFVLRTRARPGCSDGMSDKRYPLAVELLVGGERRTGCAEPL
ncbi:MAG TPA: hypothetical protein VF759_03475 [Allosphingosinicella sp.]|jgi:uncharacterized membrane protein